MPAGMASIISILARIWATGSELLWILIVVAISNIRMPDKKQIDPEWD
jgi:hypothetical protein